MMMSRSIMSGDSPNAHRNEIFEFKEGRSSPTPTSSKDIGVQSGSGVVTTASVSVEPPKEKDKEKEDDHVELSSPILNNPSDERRGSEGNDTTFKFDEMHSGGGKDGGDKRRKLNGSGDGGDTLDGVYMPSRDVKPPKLEEEEEENCMVNCLYYSMQCCDCTIM